MEVTASSRFSIVRIITYSAYILPISKSFMDAVGEVLSTL